VAIGTPSTEERHVDALAAALLAGVNDVIHGVDA
jgi:hypothetical protein